MVSSHCYCELLVDKTETCHGCTLRANRVRIEAEGKARAAHAQDVDDAVEEVREACRLSEGSARDHRYNPDSAAEERWEQAIDKRNRALATLADLAKQGPG